MVDALQREMLHKKLLCLVGCNTDIAKLDEVSAFVRRAWTERVQHEHAARARQPRKVLGVARTPGFINRVQAADVKNEIERLAHAERIQARHIGDVKVDCEIRALGFCARKRNRFRRKIHADNGEAGLCEINRVGPCAAAEVERSTASWVVLNERNNLRRRAVAVPRRLGKAVLKIEEEFTQIRGQLSNQSTG